MSLMSRLSACCLLGVSIGAHAPAAIPDYALVGSFQLPAAVSAYDVLPDGRLITIVGDDIFTQDSPNTSSWSHAGSVAPGLISFFGASFIRVSPDAATIAIGDNNFGPGAMVHLFSAAALDPMNPAAPSASFTSSNLDAHWAGTSTLFVTGATAGGEVTLIDLSSNSARTVLNNIGLSAGGVTVRGGSLFIGNGFDLSGSTGDVRAFDLATITSAVTPIDYESPGGGGITVARALSGASLDFDPFGNLLVGGGDLFGGSNDFGSAAVIDSVAIDAALLGGPVAPDSAELRLTPGSPFDSYFTRFNHATNELLITVFDNSTFSPGLTVYRYAIPSPPAALIVVLVLALRRRRA